VSILRPLPRSVTRPLTYIGLAAWVVTMAALVNRSYLQASSANLATDLASYGSTAAWSGIYYRGEKIGFTVSQTTRTETGYELRQDGRLQMLLLGQDTAATIRTTARVDEAFVLESFDFSLDPGTGPTEIRGTVTRLGNSDRHRLAMLITAGGSTRSETRELPSAPVMSLNLPRVLAAGGLVPGSSHTWMVLDPATLHAAPMTVRVGERSVVRTGETMLPAFRLEMEFQGLRTTSWITDTGDVVREESPLGLMTIRESAERARGLSVSTRVQADLLRSSAIVPEMRQRIDDPRNVRRLRLRLSGAEFPARADMDGAGQSLIGEIVEITDARALRAGPLERDLDRYLAPEAFIESDAPEIVAEVQQALKALPSPVSDLPSRGNGREADRLAGDRRPESDDRAKARQLVRYVNRLLEKKPTVSLPSAREVLRTRVGDCNEHTALYVAMARAAGLPARIAVGVVYMQGAFYYHAWPEVYVRETPTTGLWLPVDPTLDQFPADTTHLRFARGGLDKQAAIVPLIGRLRMTVLDVDVEAGSTPVVVGRDLEADLAALPLAVPRASGSDPCRCPDEAQ
jgi:transglutaminase-like putative cysteine protease